MKNNKKIMIIGALSAMLAFSSSAIAKEKIEVPKSSFGIDYTFMDSDQKIGNKLDFNGSLSTKYGLFNLETSKAKGKQRIIPTLSNVVTNGNLPRDFYNLEKGNSEEIKLGYGAKKEVLDNLLFGVKVGIGFGKAETDISSNTIGYQKKKGIGLLFGLSITDLNENGLKIGYKGKSIEENSRFIEGFSDEKINSDIYSISYELGLNNNSLKITPFFTLEKESSNLKFSDTMPGQIIIDRKISHTKRKPGIELKLFNSNNEDFNSISFNLIQGTQRHEFTPADTKGYGFKLVRKQSNYKLSFKGEYENNSSHTSTPSIDPSTGLPIELQFKEKRKNWNLNSEFETDKFDFVLGYNVSEKTGSTKAFVPMFGITLPIAEGEDKYHTTSLDLAYNISKSGTIKLKGKREFKHDGFELGIGYSQKF